MPTKPCKLDPQKECWGCIDALREIVQRSATGATVHRLNNIIMTIFDACNNGNTKLYAERMAKFFSVLKGE
jgi:hypothetical protein